MSAVTLKAHFDGTSIQLDEPYELPPNAKLLVTVLAPTTDGEANDWLAWSQRNLARAYGEQEPEYGEADLLP